MNFESCDWGSSPMGFEIHAEGIQKPCCGTDGSLRDIASSDMTRLGEASAPFQSLQSEDFCKLAIAVQDCG